MADIEVYLETSPKRVFACAYEWPGYARAGRDEASAMETLAEYEVRYKPVVAAAGLTMSAGSTAGLRVVERIPGDATTAFGAPSKMTERDLKEPAVKEKDRLLALLSSCWQVFDQVAADSPEELVKGPRGGGRDRTKIVAHVLAAEAGYSRHLGAKLREPAPFDIEAIAAHREVLAAALRAADATMRREPDSKRWPIRYAVRRIAWHVLDHAWEIEDRRP